LTANPSSSELKENHLRAGLRKAIETEYGVTDVSVISRKRTADLRNKWILPKPFVSRCVVEVGWNRVSKTSRPKGERFLH